MPIVGQMDYSIIICTYNPDENIFIRCLNAVSALNNAGLKLEFIVVDNNSKFPLAEMLCVQDFLKKVSSSKLLLVKEQGLSYARMAGVEASKSENIIFFDDDNEPDSNYIQVLSNLHQLHPQVVAWGPGNVDVDFINGISKTLENYALDAFQNRQEKFVTYSNQQEWQSCYPYGTGLCIKGDYLKEYMLLAKQNKFTLTDRKGEQTSSGEDTQMVLFCISKGGAAGVAPDLKLIHMIPAKRTTFNYLKRLTYGTSVSYSTCISEVFPNYVLDLEKKILSDRRFVIKTLKKYLMLFFKTKPKKTFDLIAFMGSVSGDYKVLDRPVPFPVTWVLRKLKAI